MYNVRKLNIWKDDSNRGIFRCKHKILDADVSVRKETRMSEKYNQILVEMMLLVPKVNFMEIKERRCGKLCFPIYLSESILNKKIDEL